MVDKKQSGNQLKVLIQSLVREELKNQSKVIAKIIKEQVRSQVKAQVNEILAEQFIKSMSSGGNMGLKGVFAEQTAPAPAVKSVVESNKQREIELSKLRERAKIEKMKNLGVFGTDAQSLFEDLEQGSINSKAGLIADNDGEGVDLDKLGL